MPTFKKRPFFFFFFLSIVFIFLGFLFYTSYQLDRIKTPVISYLKSRIQGDVQIADVHLSIFPPRLRLKQVKLFALGDQTPSATIEEVVLRFNSFSFFKKDIDTSIQVRKPFLKMILSADGKNNFQKIFEPILLNQPPANSSSFQFSKWKRLNVTQLMIQDARFISQELKNKDSTEIKNLDIQADEIGFNSAQEPAHLKISFELPELNRALMKLDFHLRLDPARQILHVENGKVLWGAVKMGLSGEAFLPDEKRKNVELALVFSAPSVNLKKLSEDFKKPLPFTGDLSLKGKILGSAFSPSIQLQIDSQKINFDQKKEISKLHAEIEKKEKAIQIQKASFEMFGGSVSLTGTLLPEKYQSGNFDVSFQNLSLAQIKQKPDPAKEM